eukprot:m51a1_g11228 Down syndrome critical region protein 3 paralogue A (311) ;mRNA; f:21830-23610
MSGPVLDIRLKRADRVYRAGDVVSGVVVVVTRGALSHAGIGLQCEGAVQLQLSAKNVGLFEAFYNSVKPITLLQLSFDIAKPGKLPDGVSELPFEFKLEPLLGQQLYETYHGVFVNITYSLKVDMKRGMLSKDLSKVAEFIVEIPNQGKGDVFTNSKTGKPIESAPVKFRLTPEAIDSAKRSKRPLPKFAIEGTLDTAVCDISKPLTGTLVVAECDAPIKSVEMQLVRVETCGCADGYAKEATEIQNIQVGEGDVARGMPLRMHMVFPRLFTCPSIATRTFKIEFEVNVVVMLEDNHLITEGFPLRLVRL